MIDWRFEFQIEDHLFHEICHVHNRKLLEVVKSTVSELGLPYKCTFVQALQSLLYHL